MASDPTPEAVELAMKARMGKFLVHDVGGVSARTLVMLQKQGVFKQDTPVEVNPVVAAALADEAHPARAAAGRGPLVVVRSEESGVNEVSDASMLFFGRDAEIRCIAARYFDAPESQTPWVTRKTAGVIRSHSDALQSGDPQIWRTAAVAIVDTLADDWLVNLAGVRQSIQMQFEEGYADFMPRVLRPTRQALEAIQLPIWSPAEERAKLVKQVEEIAAAATGLEHSMDRYMDLCGWVPLSGSLAMSRVVDDWIAAKTDSPQMWTRLWDWAEGKQTPFARYHVCEVLFRHPEYVPDERRGAFWREVTEVVDVRGANETVGSVWSEGWRLRCELARHYCHHIECILPGSSGERDAIAAWWMAERVGSILGQNAAEIAKFRERTLTPSYSLSAQMWNQVYPPTRSCGLRYMTLFERSLWAVALQTRIGASLGSLTPDAMSNDDRARIEEAFKASVLFGFSRKTPGQVTTYAFEENVVNSAATWADRRASSDGPLKGLVAVNHEIMEMDIATLLGLLGKGNEADDVVISQALACWAFQGEVSAEDVWKEVLNENWRKAAFLSCSEKATGLLFGALRELMVAHAGDWASHLPHFLALAAEEATSEVRRSELFTFTVLAATAAGNSSAVRRLLTGEKKHEFRDDATRYREQIAAMYPLAVPWAMSRMRATQAALHV